MRQGARPRWLALVVSVGLLGLTACGANPQDKDGRPSGELTVFAAASLTEAFTEIGKDFEQANQGVTVKFNFAGSSTLAQQLARGAPAGVFASANPKQMGKVADAGLAAGEPAIFTRNTLQIVVPKGNPAGVTGLADFGKEDLALAVCAPEVPCGALAQELFDIAGVEPVPDTRERDVKAVLTKVSLGEADAGLVYRTDVASANGDVSGIDFPEAAKEANDYPIAVLKDAPNGPAAQEFVDYVRSGAGQQVLAKFGFVAAQP